MQHREQREHWAKGIKNSSTQFGNSAVFALGPVGCQCVLHCFSEWLQKRRRRNYSASPALPVHQLARGHSLPAPAPAPLPSIDCRLSVCRSFCVPVQVSQSLICLIFLLLLRFTTTTTVSCALMFALPSGDHHHHQIRLVREHHRSLLLLLLLLWRWRPSQTFLLLVFSTCLSPDRLSFLPSSSSSSNSFLFYSRICQPTASSPPLQCKEEQRIFSCQVFALATTAAAAATKSAIECSVHQKNAHRCSSSSTSSIDRLHSLTLFRENILPIQLFAAPADVVVGSPAAAAVEYFIQKESEIRASFSLFL